MKKNYVNNKRLYTELVAYREKKLHAELNNLSPPKIPEYIGECVLLISQRLANRPNFSGYTYKEEMISDGIENCFLYALNNFDPEKTKNPFAYFTQIIKFAFIRRIDKEKKQQYIKLKNVENYDLHNEFSSNKTKASDYNGITDDFIRDYEDRLTTKKRNAKVNTSNTVSKFLINKE